MIIVKNRELLIPRNEQYIGTPNDNNADNRVFRISRLSQTGEDLSGLTYRLDLLYPDKRNVYTVSAVTSRSGRGVVVLTTLFARQYPAAGTYTFSFDGTNWKYNNQNVTLSEVGIIIAYNPVSGDTVTVTSTIQQVITDTVLLSKEITDEYINLTWTVTAAQLAIPGTVYVTLRGANEDAEVRWASFQGAFYVEQNNYTPAMFTGPMSELEYFEQVLSSNLVKLEYLPTKYEELEDAVEDAEAWAKGTRSGSEVQEEDDTYHNNSKYYSELANASKNAAAASQRAAAASQNAAAASASQTAQIVPDLINGINTETNRAKAAENTLQQNISTEAAARAATDSSLQSQINQYVNPSTQQPDEVVNARVGADGTTYSTLGDAVRGQVTDLKRAIGTNNIFEFTRIAGAGSYWNNTIDYETAAGTEAKVTLIAYGGQYLNRVYILGLKNGVSKELGQIFNVGESLAIKTTQDFDQYRFAFYTTQDDGAIKAKVGIAANKTYGLTADVLSLESGLKATNDELHAGNEWREFVEIDNLSGAYLNTVTPFTKNGTDITGYVTKIYDVENITEVRFSGTAYSVQGIKADGTRTVLNPVYPASNAIINVADYKKLAVSAAKDKFYGANRIVVEGNTKLSSAWQNKKIVWFGTSISAGGFKGSDNPLSYPFLVGRLLGATVYNESVGDSGVHYRELNRVTATNPYGFNFYFVSASRCLTNTIAMMEWIGNWADYYCNGGTYKNPEEWDPTIFTSGLPTSWTDVDTEAIKQFSYENKLDKYLTDATFPDLFVFDHGYNDRIRWADNTGTYEAQLAEYGRDNCYTFRGAMNFLIDRILSFNPWARIIMIGDYEAQSDEKKYDSVYQMRVAEDYEIPIFKLWEYTGWSQVQESSHYNWSSGLLNFTANSVQTKTCLAWTLADGIHPHSDLTGRATRIMARLIAPFIDKLK